VSILLYPADIYACGQFRITWPGELLKSQGHDILIDPPHQRILRLAVTGPENRPDSQVRDVLLPGGVDTVVFQRPLHKFIAQAVPVLRAKGVAVVVDIDDDLRAIHPDNAAFIGTHPRGHRQQLKAGGWRGKNLDKMEARLNRARPLIGTIENVIAACRDATLVTVSTPKLLARYAAHGRGMVINNYLPPHYYGQPRVDSNLLCWPAVLWTHPNDPVVVGNGLYRVLQDTEVRMAVVGRYDEGQRGIADAFNLIRFADRIDDWGPIELRDWPAALARIGIGLAPLADTAFSAAKSWLKPLELSACGVPWVASPRVEYRRLHQLGAGWLAEKPNDWYRKVKLLAGSAAARSELSDAGRAVARDLQLERHVWRHAEAWDRARQMQRGALVQPA
jgi:hypothetical protein